MKLRTLLEWAAYFRKGLAAAAGVSALLISGTLVSGRLLAICELVLAVATVAGVVVPGNGPRPGDPPTGPTLTEVSRWARAAQRAIRPGPGPQ